MPALPVTADLASMAGRLGAPGTLPLPPSAAEAVNTSLPAAPEPAVPRGGGQPAGLPLNTIFSLLRSGGFPSQSLALWKGKCWSSY